MLRLAILLFILCVRAQEEEEGGNDKSVCIGRFVQWCDAMDYPGGTGVSLQSYMYHDEKGQFNRVFCSTDSEGTNCTRNGSPWFDCTPEHALTYKGRPLTSESSPDDVDDDVCRSAEAAFDNLMLQNNVSFNNETLRAFQENMDSFYREMEALREQMQEMMSQMFGGGSLLGGFDRWPFSRGDDADATEAPPSGAARDNSNQIGEE